MPKHNGFTGHGNSHKNHSTFKLNKVSERFQEKIAERMARDISKARKNNNVLIIDEDFGFHYQECILCFDSKLKHIELDKIEDNYYKCPECGFVKIKSDLYEKYFINNNRGEKLTIKQKIMNCFQEEKKELTNKEISEITGIDIDSIRTVIKRDLENNIIKFTGQFRNRYKIYKLIEKDNEAKQSNNGLIKETRKGYKAFNILFTKTSELIAKEGKITLKQFLNLVNHFINREFIKNLNKKLSGANLNV